MQLDEYLRFAAALLVVLALIFGLAILMRYLLPRYYRRLNSSTGRTLSIIESLPIDGKNKILVIRHQGIDHLVLLGQGCLSPLHHSNDAKGSLHE